MDRTNTIVHSLLVPFIVHNCASTKIQRQRKIQIHVVVKVIVSLHLNSIYKNMNIKINNVQLKRGDGGGGCISTSHSESVSYRRRSIGGFLHGLNTLSSQLSFFWRHHLVLLLVLFLFEDNLFCLFWTTALLSIIYFVQSFDAFLVLLRQHLLDSILLTMNPRNIPSRMNHIASACLRLVCLCVWILRIVCPCVCIARTVREFLGLNVPASKNWMGGCEYHRGHCLALSCFL